MTKEKDKSDNSKRKSLYPEYTMFIKDLAKIIKDAQLNEIEFKENDIKIKITRDNGSGSAQFVQPLAQQPIPQGVKIVEQIKTQVDIKEEAEEDYTKNPNTLLSPMVGVVYTAPNPESEDFTKVGDSVKKGDTLLLIEAMKVFNTIKAHKDGKVTKIMVKANQAVEYNQVLLVIE